MYRYDNRIPSLYSWRLSGYTACSVSCGHGTSSCRLAWVRVQITGPLVSFRLFVRNNFVVFITDTRYISKLNSRKYFIILKCVVIKWHFYIKYRQGDGYCWMYRHGQGGGRTRAVLQRPGPTKGLRPCLLPWRMSANVCSSFVLVLVFDCMLNGRWNHLMTKSPYTSRDRTGDRTCHPCIGRPPLLTTKVLGPELYFWVKR